MRKVFAEKLLSVPNLFKLLLLTWIRFEILFLARIGHRMLLRSSHSEEGD